MNAAFLSLLRNTLRLGLRARLIHVFMLLALLLLGCAILAATFSPRQPRIVLLDVGFSALRIALIVLALCWVDILFTRLLAGPGRMLALLYPVSRAGHLGTVYLAVLILLALAASALGLILTGLAALPWPGSPLGIAGGPLWAVIWGLWCDVAVVAAFVILVSSLSSAPALPYLLGICFAVAGKGLGASLAHLAEQGANGSVMPALQSVMHSLPYLLPDLSRLDWRVWALYGSAPSAAVIIWAMLMAFAYAALMILLATRFFARRDLS